MSRMEKETRPYTIAAVFGAVIVALGIYMLYAKPFSPAVRGTLFAAGAAPGFAAATNGSSAAPSGPLAPPRTPPGGSHEYRNAVYRFSLFYPDALSVKTYDEGGGASTVVFQNPQEAKGFQIFIVPYQGNQVSMARFREDDPSGVMERPTNILVGGARATMFFSTNAALGDTIEAWVIENGYLFEITAPKSLDIWLATIMQTWEFL